MAIKQVFNGEVGHMQTKWYWWLIAVLLSATSLLLTDCTGLPAPTPQVAPPESPTKTMPVTVTSVAQAIKLQLITADRPLGVRWSRDGRAIIYAEKSKQDGTESQYLWYEFDIVTRQHLHAKPPVTIAPQVWTQLGAIRPVPEDNLWFEGRVSPSGTRIIYARPQPEYTPQPNKPRLPSFEVWVAKTDGTQAKKLGGPLPCGYLAPAIWFDQERKSIIDCSYEGPSHIYVADMENSSVAQLSEVTAFQGTTDFGSFTLSPDETKLAITDLSHTLQIVPLDGSKVQAVAQWGYEPRWSSDNRQLYYQQGQNLDNCRNANVHVYDVATRTNRVVLEFPIHTSDGKQINVACGGPFEISPRESAAVIWSSGLWLLEWTR